MPVHGNTVLPSADTSTPDTPVPAHVLLTPADFHIPPRKRPFTPSEIAPHFGVCARTIIRAIERGELRGVLIGGTWRVPWSELQSYLMRQQGAMN